ncbi:MAG: hypothetical protein ACREWG_04415 [Gammaproteobacteria bacterium]
MTQHEVRTDVIAFRDKAGELDNHVLELAIAGAAEPMLGHGRLR